jgi:hypothetical protein
VFVGELSPQADFAQLASNLRTRRRGELPALGRLVAWESFRSYARTASDERLELLLAETGLEPVELDALLVEPPAGPPRRGDAFEVRSNAVYLPIYPTATAHSNREDLANKGSGYIQLALDPERALAEYVASLFNTELGRALRESISRPGTAPIIRRSAVTHLRLPLPTMEVQQDVVAASARMRSLRVELDGLERRLSARPDEVP